MVILTWSLLSTPRRADLAPGRCRAGGGLLGGKDPTGRFLPRVSQRCEVRNSLRVVAGAPGWPLGYFTSRVSSSHCWYSGVLFQRS